MSTFDPAAFENSVIEQSNETKATPVPEGDYSAIIDEAKIKTVTVKGEEKPVLQVNFSIMDIPEAVQKMFEGRDKIVVRHDIWLDVTEAGALAFGPNLNLALGRLREAVGLNKPGKPFTFKQLEGQGPLTISVGVKQSEKTGDHFNVVNKVVKG